jgi:hypothetical protein
MRDTGPVRKDLPGDEAAPYIGVARTLLGVLKNRMLMGGITSLTSTSTLPDGTVITVSSVNGQDTIRVQAATAAPAPAAETVHTPPVKPVHVHQPTPVNACLWGPDTAVYSPPIDAFNTGYYAAVMSPQRDRVFVVVNAPGQVEFLIDTTQPPGSVTNASQLVQLDPKTLVQVGSSLIDYPDNSAGALAASADKVTGWYCCMGQVRLPVYNVPSLTTIGQSTNVWGPNGGAAELIPGDVQTQQNPGVAHWINLKSLGTTYGKVLVVEQFSNNETGVSADQVHTMDPTTGAMIDTLAGWGGNNWASSHQFQCLAALANGNFLLALASGSGTKWSISEVNPSGAMVSSFPAITANALVAGCVQSGNIAWVQTGTGIYKTAQGKWTEVTSFTGNQQQALLTYDNYKDAVAVLNQNGQSVTIYGGLDCLGNVMDSNVVNFKNPPAFTTLGVGQMENGTLLVTDGTASEVDFSDDPTDTPSTVTVARFDLGVLNQIVSESY